MTFFFHVILQLSDQDTDFCFLIPSVRVNLLLFISLNSLQCGTPLFLLVFNLLKPEQAHWRMGGKMLAMPSQLCRPCFCRCELKQLTEERVDLGLQLEMGSPWKRRGNRWLEQEAERIDLRLST